jgi:hypothetical protein
MQELVIGGIYKHFKGHVYKLLFVAKDADNLKEKIVYQNLDNENDIWVRDKEEFLSLVDKDKYPKVDQKFRFELIEK